MRHNHPITPAVVHRRASQALSTSLDWKPFNKSVSVNHLLDLLLLMAASTASLFAVVRRFFAFSHQTATLAVKANLPDRAHRDRLTRGLVQALFDVAQFSRRLDGSARLRVIRFFFGQFFFSGVGDLLRVSRRNLPRVHHLRRDIDAGLPRPRRVPRRVHAISGYRRGFEKAEGLRHADWHRERYSLPPGAALRSLRPQGVRR